MVEKIVEVIGVGVLIGLAALMSSLSFVVGIIGLFNPEWLKQRSQGKTSPLHLFGGGVFFLLCLIAFTTIDVGQNGSTPETSTGSPKSTQDQEDISDGGFMDIRILADDALDLLKIKALSAEKDPGYLYPSKGPIAIATLPVDSLGNSREITKLLPLVCEVTVDTDPNLWSEYSEVRLLNRHSYIGFRLGSLRETCDSQREQGRLALGDRIVVGNWGARFPWRLASPAGSIGYGDQK